MFIVLMGMAGAVLIAAIAVLAYQEHLKEYEIKRAIGHSHHAHHHV